MKTADDELLEHTDALFSGAAADAHRHLHMEIWRLKRIEPVELDILGLHFQGAGMETVPPIGIGLSQSPHLEVRQRLERHLNRRAGRHR